MLRTALGPSVAAYLEDPSIVEVMLNPDGRLWIDRLSGGLEDTGCRVTAADAERIVRLVAHHVGVEVHAGSPRVSAELPESGERFEGLVPPVVAAPCFAIRRPAVAVFTLENYVEAGIMTERQAEFLCAAVYDRKNILVAGGTSTGKTTLVNALLAEVARTGDRVVLIEDTREADAAIQGLGRTNRTNQAQPPLFRPIATNVKAEKRFLSTIARRLDTLGAITKGQRQTGGQGLFRPEDNLESSYARDALRQLYLLLVAGKVEGCTLQLFEDATGLKLTDSNGIRDELPPITTFLNRLLALTIDLQNILFTAFEQLLTARIEGAVASGTYDIGLETLTAESFIVTGRRTIYTHPGTSAETRLLSITQRERNRPVTLDQALERLADKRAVLLVNTQSGRAAVQVPASSVMLDDGEVERRVRLIRPMEHPALPLAMMPQTQWREADRETFARAWEAELAQVPEFTDSEIHIVAGLLLPIWKWLPHESSRVYRLQTDAGERIIGRRVSPAWVATTLDVDKPTLSAGYAFTALMDGKTILDLSEGLQLRRVRVMGANRIELTGFTDQMRDRLAMFAGRRVRPLASGTFAGFGPVQPHEEGAPRRVVDVANQPVAAFPPAVGEVVAARRLGIARETMRQIGGLMAHPELCRAQIDGLESQVGELEDEVQE